MNLISIGKTLKPHGKDGQLRMTCDDPFDEYLEGFKALFIDLDGSKVPFLIENINFKNHILVKLDEVDSPEEASLYAMKDVYIESSALPKDVLNSISDKQSAGLQGFKIYDQNDRWIGEVYGIIESDLHTLLEVDAGGKQFVLPFHEDILIDIDPESKSMKLEIMDGLLDLN